MAGAAYLNSMPTKCAKMVLVQACRQQRAAAVGGRVGRPCGSADGGQDSNMRQAVGMPLPARIQADSPQSAPTCTLKTSNATGGGAMRCPLMPAPYTPAPALLRVLATRPPTMACGGGKQNGRACERACCRKDRSWSGQRWVDTLPKHAHKLPVEPGLPDSGCQASENTKATTHPNRPATPTLPPAGKWLVTNVSNSKFEMAYTRGSSRLMKYFKGSNDKVGRRWWAFWVGRVSSLVDPAFWVPGAAGWLNGLGAGQGWTKRLPL